MKILKPESTTEYWQCWQKHFLGRFQNIGDVIIVVELVYRNGNMKVVSHFILIWERLIFQINLLCFSGIEDID